MSDAAVERPNRELGQLLTFDPASYPTSLEGGILPPSLLLPVSLPGFPAERGEPRIGRGEHCFRTVQSPPASMNGTRSSG